MSNGSLVVLKGIRCNNLYYLKGSIVIEYLASSKYLEGDSTKLWQTRLGHIGLDFFQTLARQGLLEGVLTCNLEFGERCVLDKKTKVKFDIVIHRSKGLLGCVYIDTWGHTKTVTLGGHRCFVSFVDNLTRHCWVYLIRQRFEVLDLFVK